MAQVIGIDEAGRGSWAGPLVAVAVELGPTSGLQLRDSKQISRNQRLSLLAEIKQNAQQIGIGWVSADFIDEFGLTVAQAKAMGLALSQLSVGQQSIIIDGSINFLQAIANTNALVKGDQQIPAIMAASIIAKVTRDAYMKQLDVLHPHYGFAQHAGYGTAMHRQALAIGGACAFHRISYRPLQHLKRK